MTIAPALPPDDFILVREQAYAANLRQHRHGHRETSVTMVLAGSIREQVGRAVEIARPLSIVVKPLDTDHADEFGPEGANTLQIVIPGSMQSCLAGWNAPFARWHWHHAGPATAAFLRLVAVMRKHRSCESAMVQNAVIGALGALSATHDATPRGRPPEWLQRVRRELDDSREHASVRSLARAANVHPVYLARQFRRWYGCSITEYTRRRRVQHAAVELAAAGNLSAVAHETGFTDHPQFCRMFKRETGMTPSAFRAIAPGDGQRISDATYAPAMLAPAS